jgi:hypothetical protein
MATFQKYKQGQGNNIVGTQTIKNTLYTGTSKSPTLGLHIVEIKNSVAIRGNLIAECDLVDGVVDAIISEVNPLAYVIGGVSSSNAGGNLFLVTDAKVSSRDIQHRIRQIGANAAATRGTGNAITSATTFTYANTAVSERAVDISGTIVHTVTGNVGFIFV